MNLEIAFKVVLTSFLTIVWLAGVRWVWTTQLDSKATLDRLLRKTVAPPEWVATRDPNKIYQDGKVVADVTGPVREEGQQVHFAQLANTSNLDARRDLEYQRHTLRIVRVGKSIGMKVETSEEGSKTLTSVLEDVVCQKIR